MTNNNKYENRNATNTITTSKLIPSHIVYIILLLPFLILIAIFGTITTLSSSSTSSISSGVHAYSILPTIELINNILISPTTTVDSSLVNVQPSQCRIRIINTIVYKNISSSSSQEHQYSEKDELIDVVLNSSRKIEGLSYLSLTDYMTVPTGLLSIELFKHSDKRALNTVGKTIYRLENDTDYTFVLSGVQIEHYKTKIALENKQQQQQQEEEKKNEQQQQQEKVSVSILSDINTFDQQLNQHQKSNQQIQQQLLQPQHQQQQQQTQPTTSTFSPNRLNLRFVQCIHDLPSNLIDFDVQGGATLLSKIRYLPDDKKGVSSTYISIPSRFYTFQVHEHEQMTNNYLTFDSSIYYQQPAGSSSPLSASASSPLPSTTTSTDKIKINNINNNHNSNGVAGSVSSGINGGQLYINLLMVGSYEHEQDNKYSIQIISLPSSESSLTQQHGFIQTQGDRYYQFKGGSGGGHHSSPKSSPSQRGGSNSGQRHNIGESGTKNTPKKTVSPTTPQSDLPPTVQQNPSSISSPTSTFHFSLAIISFALLFGLSVI